MCLVSSVLRFHEFEMGLYYRRSALRSHVGPALQRLGAKGANLPPRYTAVDVLDWDGNMTTHWCNEMHSISDYIILRYAENHEKSSSSLITESVLGWNTF